MRPDAGETARIVRHSDILVGEGMLVLQVFYQELTRGATGKVWFTLENTGDADIEIITARNGGKSPSGDVAFSLLDGDDNLLSTLDFKQVTGANVITLSNHDTVARIAPGAIFTSEPVQMPVPASTPDNPKLRVDIADVYHHYGWDDELIMRGLGSSRQAAINDTPYSGQIDTVSPAVSTGDGEILITGQAVSTADGTPMPDADLSLVITLGHNKEINSIERLSPAYSAI